MRKNDQLWEAMKGDVLNVLRTAYNDMPAYQEERILTRFRKNFEDDLMEEIEERLEYIANNTNLFESDLSEWEVNYSFGGEEDTVIVEADSFEHAINVFRNIPLENYVTGLGNKGVSSYEVSIVSVSPRGRI